MSEPTLSEREQQHYTAGTLAMRERQLRAAAAQLTSTSPAEPDETALQWQDRGLCAQTDPEAFFPEKGGSSHAAKRICNSGCPVKAECLDYALTHNERFGVWGGMSERERRRYSRGLLAPVIPLTPAATVTTTKRGRNPRVA